LIAADPGTGRELWRWRPTEGFSIDRLVWNGDRLVVSDGHHVYGLLPGEPPTLPTDEHERRELARHTLALMRGFESWDAGYAELALRLIRLGKSSVAPLMDGVRARLADVDRRLPAPGEVHSWRDSVDSPLDMALNVLVDIGDVGPVPELARLLATTGHPEGRRSLAEALIHLGDSRARCVLFAFARDSANQPVSRRAALYFVCRAAAPAGAPANPSEVELTQYLQSQLQNQAAPRWLRSLACFELLNGRGEQSREMALALFNERRTARLLPRNPILTASSQFEINPKTGFPSTIDTKAAFRDARGTRWCAFRSEYLGDHYDIWIAQSKDGKSWSRPTFAISLAAACRKGNFPDHMSIRCGYYRGRLAVAWREDNWRSEYRGAPRRSEVALRALYQDADGDGLTDLLERRIGTDARRADTNGNGIPDGQDKNPLYRPHPLSDEEGIYRAAWEALYQHARLTRVPDGQYEEFREQPVAVGTPTGPLAIPPPLRSSGIEVTGSDSVVLCSPRTPVNTLQVYSVFGSNHFVTPHIELDGTWSVRERGFSGRPSLFPVTDSRDPPALTFRDFFPYQRSRDGTRARVGWKWETGMNGHSEGWDVEVRKTGGQWRPVECRKVYETARMRITQMPTPVRPWQDNPASGRGGS